MRYRLRTLLPPSRWLRFSLRTLLLLTLVIAVGLGVIMKRLRDRKAAYLAINSAGGTMALDITGPEWLQALIDDEECFYDPVHVNLGPIARQQGQEEPKLDDSLLARLAPTLKQFPHLKVLDIRRSTITDRSAKVLGTFDTLTRLRLSQTPITNQTVRHISRLRRLEVLELNGTAITDDCVDDLCHLAKLTHLDLQQTAITGDGLSRLHQKLPRCKVKN